MYKRQESKQREITSGGRFHYILEGRDINTGISEGFVTHHSQTSWTSSAGFFSGKKPQDLSVGGNVEIQQFNLASHLIYLCLNTWMLYKHLEQRCLPRRSQNQGLVLLSRLSPCAQACHSIVFLTTSVVISSAICQVYLSLFQGSNYIPCFPQNKT